jgi:hypothetical protein
MEEFSVHDCIVKTRSEALRGRRQPMPTLGDRDDIPLAVSQTSHHGTFVDGVAVSS